MVQVGQHPSLIIRTIEVVVEVHATLLTLYIMAGGVSADSVVLTLAEINRTYGEEEGAEAWGREDNLTAI